MAVVCHMDTSSHRIVARMSLEVCRHFGWRFISVTPCLIQLGIQRHTLWRRLGTHGGDFTNTAATLNIPPRIESVTPNKPRTQPLASTGGGGRQRTYQPNQPNNPTSTRARDLCNLLSSYERGHGLDTTLRLGNSALDVWSGGAHAHQCETSIPPEVCNSSCTGHSQTQISTRARDLCNLLSSYERGHGLDTTLRLGNSA